MLYTKHVNNYENYNNLYQSLYRFISECNTYMDSFVGGVNTPKL